MFGKLWQHKMYGRGLAGGALTQAQFLDCVLKNLPVNLMVLLDCHCALICASFLGSLINWMLSGTDRRWKEMTTETGLWTFGLANCPRNPSCLAHLSPVCPQQVFFSFLCTRLGLYIFANVSCTATLCFQRQVPQCAPLVHFCFSKPCIFNCY